MNKNRIFTIPNTLSMFRIFLIPIIVWLYVFEEQFIGAGVVTIISGLTDIIDGYIARNFNLTSEFGKILDPIADKLTQAFILFSIMTRFPYLLIPLILLVIKEISTGILGLTVIRRTRKVVGAKWHGKVNTILLYAMMIIHMVFYNIPYGLSYAFVGISTLVMIVSLVLYVRLYLNVLREYEKRH